MTSGALASPSSVIEPYSPERRTALVFTGVGTAGIYHAGVIRALQEAGVKIDVVAGRGIGAISAMFTAIDGAQRLWDVKGFWRAAAARRLYPWDPLLRLLVIAAGAAAVAVLVPLLVMAAGLAVFPLEFVLSMTGLSDGGLATGYLDFARLAFAPTALPTWLPRIAVLLLTAAALVAAFGALTRRGERHGSGPFWWRLMPAPLSSESAVELCWAVLWDLLRGAAAVRQPPAPELGRRYTEVLAEGLGQPGFRELVLAVHDLDARRDLVFALVRHDRRRDLVHRATTPEASVRRAEVMDLAGVARDHFADAIAASMSMGVATEPHVIAFPPESYWRGERHRLCDRPASLVRLIEELADLEVRQVVLVSAAPDISGPHALAPPRVDGKARLGSYLQSDEAAMVRDIARGAVAGVQIFTIRPAHNPFGPFDFKGGFDDRSDRRRPPDELMQQGYEDAYHQFIEPVVGASGERVG
jgi:hypothetical protein